MKTVDVSKEEMITRTARFSNLKPYKQTQNDANGIPPEAMEMISAKSVYPVMVPDSWEGRSSIAPVKGIPGLTISLAECPPGDNPGLHVHESCVENFFCVRGKFEITWGDKGENSTILNPLDFISVPPGVSRNFVNISDEVGYLYVVIQVPEGDAFDKVAFSPSIGENIAKKFGPNTVDQMNKIGVIFNAGIDQ
jgi:uncharacterized RmlC-like cupin family protein|tara:strand:- start:228 stop:809 length:582 start_codon:yes stop_codon:yes gene_type:complete